MGTPQLHDSTTPRRMSVNVALCGSIPRSCFLKSAVAHTCGPDPSSMKCASSSFGRKEPHENRIIAALEKRDSVAFKADLIARSLDISAVLSERQPFQSIDEAPTWAVPANGETRLEPVCEGIGRQEAVDLTLKPLYRVGRSPLCDIQLLHGTSSRRHAILFHHANGSCYIVDCGSAHGTFVNGVRISPPTNGGVVVPYKVRRGALIRFGGPGAPCFVLKSFSFRLDEIVGGEDDDDEPDTGELVRRNTRLNALGASAAERIRGTMNLTHYEDFLVIRKRSFDSLATSATLDEDIEPLSKRSRCTSPFLAPESVLLRLVSPEVTKRHVRFSADPPLTFYPALVTPEESLSAEEDNDSIA